MNKHLYLRILHDLPGRLRLLLSNAPNDIGKFDRLLRTHSGIDPIRYTPAIRTLLIHYDLEQIQREELLVRVALGLSIENSNQPVRIETRKAGESLTASAVVSGIMLLIAGAARTLMLPRNWSRHLERGAGGATALAVMQHAMDDIRTQGIYHPEVLSIGYMAVTATKGNLLRASFVTWFATFGRHILENSEPSVVVSPSRESGAVVTAEMAKGPVWQSGFQILPALVKMLSGLISDSPEAFLDNLQTASQLHDSRLDPLGPWENGISISFGKA